MRPGVRVAVSGAISGAAERWIEHVEAAGETIATFADGRAALVVQGRVHYLAFWPDHAALASAIALVVGKSGLATIELPDAVRLRRRGNLVFAFNYGETPWQAPFRQTPFQGASAVEPRGHAVWRLPIKANPAGPALPS